MNDEVHAELRSEQLGLQVGDHFESPGFELPGSNLSNKEFSGGKLPTF